MDEGIGDRAAKDLAPTETDSIFISSPWSQVASAHQSSSVWDFSCPEPTRSCAIVRPMQSRIKDLLKNTKVGDLQLQADHRIDPNTPLHEVYRAFDEQRHGAAMVCDGDNVVGIFTQRDVLYRTALEDLDPSTPVSEVMSERPLTIGNGQTLAEAIEAMVEGSYRHIPVVDAEGNQVGLLSSRVILRFIADHYPEAVLNLPPRLQQVMPRPEGG